MRLGLRSPSLSLAMQVTPPLHGSCIPSTRPGYKASRSKEPKSYALNRIEEATEGIFLGCETDSTASTKWMDRLCRLQLVLLLPLLGYLGLFLQQKKGR